MPPKRKIGQQAELPPRKRSAGDAFIPRGDTAADLEEDMENLSLTAEENEFREQIEDAAKSTPRFLFRAWSEQSGGDKELNTIEAIMPHAFKYGTAPDFLYKMKQQRVCVLAENHLTAVRDPGTVFSSWSQSLAFVLSLANSAQISGCKNVHISVLDTAKLSPYNTVLHTSRFCDLVGADSGIFPWEYLAFGIITAPAYRAVPLAYFPHEYFYDGYLPAGNHQSSLKGKLNSVGRVASYFGEPLEVPVAAHIIALSVSKGPEQNNIVETLAKSKRIPVEWATDPTIMDPSVEHHGYQESERADQILRQMVIAKHGNKFFKKNAGNQKLETAAEKRAKEVKAKLARKSVMESPRVPAAAKKAYPRMLKELHITMKGFENALLDEMME